MAAANRLQQQIACSHEHPRGDMFKKNGLKTLNLPRNLPRREKRCELSPRYALPIAVEVQMFLWASHGRSW